MTDIASTIYGQNDPSDRMISVNNRTRKMEVGIAMDGNISTVKNIDECSDILFDLIQAGLVEKV